MSKDIEKLRLGERRDGEGKSDDKDGQPPGSGMSESRKKELRRMSSKRRSSKQGWGDIRNQKPLNIFYSRISPLP